MAQELEGDLAKKEVTPSLDKLRNGLFSEVSTLINEVKNDVARSVNSKLILMNWRIGKRINEEVLKNKKAGYGEFIVEELATHLSQLYGKGFSRTNLFSMMRFADIYGDIETVQTVSGLLSWSHFIELTYLENPLKREFYGEMSRIERWSVRTLKAKIQSMMFERTSIAKKPDDVIKGELEQLRKNDTLTPDLIFRDPYMLEFLSLESPYTEKDFELSILQHMEKFLLEFGADFAFLSRQKRITIDGQDYYLDLLFFHRKLRCLVAIELKMGRFKAADKGQMELYLRWLEKHETNSGEQPPIGIILCSEKSVEHVELLRLEESGIRVAQFFTELPPREVLENRLHKSIELAKSRLTS